MPFALVYITAKDQKEAEFIAKTLLEQKLIACANIFPESTALFWWQERMNKTSEAVLLAKTKNSLLKKLELVVVKIHSYDTPCIVAVPLSFQSKKYSAWLKKTLSSQKK